MNRKTNSSIANEKVFRYIVKDSSGVIYNSDTKSYFTRLILPTIITDYYLTKSKSFSQYLNTLNLEDLEKRYPQPFTLARGIYNQILKDRERFNSKLPIKPLGDVHFNGGTKYFTDNSVQYFNFPDYHDLVSNIAREVDEQIVSFFPSHIKIENQIFREFLDIKVETNDPVLVSQYYFNLGKSIPFLLLIRAIDVYSENMLISIPKPMLFDLECIFVNEFGGKYNINQTGLLCIKEGYDVSTLTGGQNKVHSYLKPKIVGTDEQPLLKWKYLYNLDVSNIPIFNGVKVDPKKYAKEILSGYRITMNRICKRKKQIKEIVHGNDAMVRHIIRHTSLYQSIIQKYCFPNIYGKHQMNEFFKQELEEGKVIYKIDINENLYRYEIESLSNGLIPVYYQSINAKDIVDPKGSLITTSFKTPVSVWEEHISNIDTFLDQQLEILKKALL